MVGTRNPLGPDKMNHRSSLSDDGWGVGLWRLHAVITPPEGKNLLDACRSVSSQADSSQRESRYRVAFIPVAYLISKKMHHSARLVSPSVHIMTEHHQCPVFSPRLILRPPPLCRLPHRYLFPIWPLFAWDLDLITNHYGPGCSNSSGKIFLPTLTFPVPIG